MVATIDIKEKMQIIGADGVPVGTVDKVEGTRIKLTRDDGHGGKMDHHHFLPVDLAADIENGKLRLSATAANAMTLRQEEDGRPVSGEATSSARDSAFAFGNATKDNGFVDRQASVQPASPGNVHETQKAVPVPPIPTVKSLGSKPKSKGIGIGAAALGLATIGAAALGASALGGSRSGTSRPKGGKPKRDKATFPLDNDENMRLISSTKVEGTKVVDRDGTAIGSIQSVMIDKYSGRVAYAILSFGGTFGFGASLFPLPWAALDYDEAKDGYVLPLGKDQMAQAPKFEARDTPEFDAPYRQRVLLFYRAR